MKHIGDAQRARTSVTLERVRAAAALADTEIQAFGLSTTPEQFAARILAAACSAYQYAFAHGEIPVEQYLRVMGQITVAVNKDMEAEEQRLDAGEAAA